VTKRPVRLIALGLLLILAGSLPACSGGGQGGKNLNVLVIVVDTLAARHLGCFTPGLANSPVIDRLAREGVLFERCYSTAPWTQPAVASLFTSQMPSDNGMTQIFTSLPDSLTTLAELMRQRGRWTMGVTANWIVTDEFGFGQGFEKLNDSPVGGHEAITSQKVTEAAELVLDRAGQRPFFLYVHYFDPHWYFNHHPDFDLTSGYHGRLTAGMDVGELRRIADELDPADIAYLEGLYREEIAYTDHWIGELLAHLEQVGLADDTLVILTADHGEEFMEHGWIGHTANLYDNLIHVPLIVWQPGRIAPGVVRAPVSLLDILPTVAALTGESPGQDDWEGRSLVDLLDGTTAGRPDRPLFAEVSYTSPDGWPSGDDQPRQFFKTALRVSRWKIIHDLLDDGWELYDVTGDPGEQDDVWNTGLAAEADLQTMLRGWEKVRGEAGQTLEPDLPALDADDLERLRSLGYVH